MKSSAMPPAVRSTVQAVRREIKAAAPTAIERPYSGAPPRSKTTLWKIARYTLGDADVAGVGAFSTHVLLYFYRGVELDDGSGLLEGGGKVMRSIRLLAPHDAARPDVRRMLRNAFRLAAKAAQLESPVGRSGMSVRRERAKAAPEVPSRVRR